MRYNYIISLNGDYYQYAFQGDQVQNISYVAYKQHTMYQKIIRKLAFYVHFPSYIQNLLIRLAFWEQYRRMKPFYSKDRQNILILSREYYLWFKNEFTRYLRKKDKNISIGVFLTDYNEPNISFYKEHKNIFDFMISYDKKQASEMNCYYHNLPFPVDHTAMSCMYDLCFIGKAKNRYEKIVNVYKHCISLGLKCAFYVIDYTADNDRIDGIHYCDEMHYSEYIEITRKSRAILEIVQSDSVGNTLRVNEAISFRKRLISNNAGLLHNDLYDSKNMFVFSNIDEIKTDLFADEEPVYDEDIQERMSLAKFVSDLTTYLDEVNHENTTNNP